MYKIKYDYRTGDSFHNEDTSSILEFEWKCLNIAKQNLKRIQEHYVFYKGIENSSSKYYKKDRELPIPPKWWNITGNNWGLDHEMINLIMDNNTEVQIHAPWCGYFEELYGAEIIVEPDTDLKFIV